MMNTKFRSHIKSYSPFAVPPFIYFG